MKTAKRKAGTGKPCPRWCGWEYPGHVNDPKPALDDYFRISHATGIARALCQKPEHDHKWAKANPRAKPAETLGDRAVEYMRDSMGLTDALEDQGENQTLRHLMQFAYAEVARASKGRDIRMTNLEWFDEAERIRKAEVARVRREQAKTLTEIRRAMDPRYYRWNAAYQPIKRSVAELSRATKPTAARKR